MCQVPRCSTASCRLLQLCMDLPRRKRSLQADHWIIGYLATQKGTLAQSALAANSQSPGEVHIDLVSLLSSTPSCCAKSFHQY